MERRGAIDPCFIAKLFLNLKCFFRKIMIIHANDILILYRIVFNRAHIFVIKNILRSENTGSDDSQTRYWILDVSLKLQCMCAYIWDRLRVLYVIFTFSVARHTLDVFLLHEKCQYLGGYITFCIDEIQ